MCTILHIYQSINSNDNRLSEQAPGRKSANARCEEVDTGNRRKMVDRIRTLREGNGNKICLTRNVSNPEEDKTYSANPGDVTDHASLQ